MRRNERVSSQSRFNKRSQFGMCIRGEMFKGVEVQNNQFFATGALVETVQCIQNVSFNISSGPYVVNQ